MKNSPLEKYLINWLEDHKNFIEPNTHRDYSGLIKRYIIPYIGDKKMSSVKPYDIEQLYLSLQRQNIGIRTIHYTHAVLRSAFEHAVFHQFMPYNPCRGVRLPKYYKEEMKILDSNEIKKFLGAAKSSRYSVLYHLALVTGMRQGELLGLSWNNVDLNSGIIGLRLQAKRIPGKGIHLVHLKTRTSQRSIRIGRGMINLLQSYYTSSKEINHINSVHDYDLVFSTMYGNPIGKSNLLKDYYRTLEMASVRKIRFHDLRHTAASMMLNQGIPVIVVSKILGHSKPSTTLDYYGHVIGQMENKAASIMDRFIS